MGTITSGVGLISGLDINSIVDQLIAIEARPRQLIQSQNTVLNSQSAAYQEVRASLLSLKTNVTTLVRPSTFRATTANSSNPDAVGITTTSTASPGSFRVSVERLVSTQQSITRGYADRDTTPLPAGSLTFESAAARLDSETRLDDLNAGNGVTRGVIRITDRVGNQADVDLSRAVTVRDVLDRINNAPGVNVRASVRDGSLVLTDLNTAGFTNALSVTDTNLGSGVAASLGLDATPVGSVLSGSNLRTLGSGSALASFFDGNGVRTKDGFGQNDLAITDRSGAVHAIDLTGVLTVDDLQREVNTVTAGAVTVSVGADGVSLDFNDNTGGGGNFTITGSSGSLAAADLGIDQSVAGNTISSRRLVSGLNSKLIGNLRGGTGATLGTITIEDRLGTSTNIDLSAAKSFSDVINTINDAAAADGLGITASLNAAGNGLLITDTTGSTSTNLVISGTGTEPGALNIQANVAANTVDSGNLQLRYVSEASLLSSLNNGRGVAPGSFRVTDSSGNSGTVSLNEGERTVQEVIDQINALGLNVAARINDTGDGLVLEDTSTNPTPPFALTVEESGSSTARDLGILGSADSAGGDLDGSFEVKINIAAPETLATTTLLDDLNAGAGISTKPGQNDLRITTADGTAHDVNLDGLSTVQDLIDRITTATGSAVTTTLNASGTGLRLVDSTTGTTTFKVEAINGSTAGEDLGILASDTDRNAEIVGTAIVSVTTLEDLAQRINDESRLRVSATIINDGSPYSPFRLSLTSEVTGSAGAFILDDNGLNLGARRLAEGRDAVVFYGGGDDPAAAVAVTSSSNTLTDLVPGATLDLKATTDSPVELTINQDLDSIVTAVQDFVSDFNTAITAIDKHDTYDAETEERGLLLGDSTLIRSRSGLFRLISQRYPDVEGRYASLSQIGFRVGQGGTSIELNAEKFREALETDREAVEQLFTLQGTQRNDEGTLEVITRGAASSFDEFLTSLTDTVDGAFQRRVDTLADQVEANTGRIEDLTARLDAKRQRLLNEFIAMERTLAQLQDQGGALASLQNLAGSARAATG